MSQLRRERRHKINTADSLVRGHWHPHVAKALPLKDHWRWIRYFSFYRLSERFQRPWSTSLPARKGEKKRKTQEKVGDGHVESVALGPCSGNAFATCGCQWPRKSESVVFYGGVLWRRSRRNWDICLIPWLLWFGTFVLKAAIEVGCCKLWISVAKKSVRVRPTRHVRFQPSGFLFSSPLRAGTESDGPPWNCSDSP